MIGCKSWSLIGRPSLSKCCLAIGSVSKYAKIINCKDQFWFLSRFSKATKRIISPQQKLGSLSDFRLKFIGKKATLMPAWGVNVGQKLLVPVSSCCANVNAQIFTKFLLMVTFSVAKQLNTYFCVSVCVCTQFLI